MAKNKPGQPPATKSSSPTAAQPPIAAGWAFAQAAIEHCGDPAFGITADGRVQYVNPAACRSLGYAREELLGVEIHTFMLEYPPVKWAELARLIRERTSHSFFTRQRTKDGRLLPVEVTATWVVADGSESFCAFARDITHHERAKQELQSVKEAAEIANRAKTAFLASMSHEIRTHMNALFALMDLLWETRLSPEQRKYVRVFRRAGGTLLTLLNDILDLSRVEAGRLHIQSVEFDLPELMDKVLEIMSMRANEKGLNLVCYIAPEVPPRVVGDPIRIQQVLVNLIGNALKFTERGDVVLHIGRGAARPDSTMLEFSVTDTGLGIPAAQLDTIFESFSQAHASSTYGGSGLGLAIAKHLVMLMGGSIRADSVEGRGSTFRFTVRLEERAEPSDWDAEPQEEFRGLKVLVADPHPTNRLILRDALSGWGAAVKEVDTGIEALEEVRAACERGNPYELVLLDCRLPDQDTFEVAEAIRSTAGPWNPAIMILTAENWADDIAQTYDLGLAGYLVKPLRRPDVFQAITIALHRARRTGPADFEPDAARPLHLRRGSTILLVDDSLDNRFLTASYLDGVVDRVEVAENGKTAVAKAQAERFDVIVMDIKMPDMDGHAATRAIREHERSKGHAPVPIIALTAYASKEEEQRCLAAGCTIYLTKPITKRGLLQAIERHLEQDRTNDESKSPRPASIQVLVDPDIFHLVPGFLSNRRNDVSVIREAIERHDYETIRILGHRMKGDGGGYGFEGISEVGAALEHASMERDPAALQKHLARLIDYLDRVDAKKGNG